MTVRGSPSSVPAMRRRILGSLVVAVVVASGGCAGSAGTPESPSTAPEVDGLIPVGDDRSIFARCAGDGTPTVVLIAGKGNGAQDWMDVLAPGDPSHDAPGDDLPWGLGELVHSDDAVFPAVAAFTRVCAYDRPDIRFEGDVTTPREQPHTVDADVEDLHRLLSAIGAPSPYVLVAHSYGGLIASLYARRYPEAVGGLVFVDAASEHIAEVVRPEQLTTWDASNATTSPQVREGVQLADAFERIAAAGRLPDVPAAVLSADKPWRMDLLPPEAVAIDTVTFEDWSRAQTLLAQALGVEQIADTDSGHDIHLYNPGLVVDTIARVVDQVRAADR